jgi:ABC-type sugar transport system substrate-binding protein
MNGGRLSAPRALRALTLLSCALACATAPGSARAQAARDGKDAAFVLRGFDGCEQGPGDWLQKMATQAGAAGVQLIDGKVDPAVQQKATDALIAAGVDGVAHRPVERAAAASPIKAARAAGIPLVLVGVRPDAASAAAPAALFKDLPRPSSPGGNAAAGWRRTNPARRPGP